MTELKGIFRLLRVSILLMLITGWSAGAAFPAEPDSAPVPEIKNVVVIVLDALRADHLGCYGYHRNTSPNIDALAEKGLVFDRAIVQAGWTKPSVTSYFTSLNPSVHRVLHYEETFPENLTTLAEVFRQNGYFTYGFVNNVHLDPSLGFGKGFNVYRKMTDQDIFHNLWQVLTGRYFDLEKLDDNRLAELGHFFLENPDRNLVKNSSFETPGEDWNGNPGWRESGVFHSGGYAARLDKQSWPETNFYNLSQDIVLEDGEDYLFGAFVRTGDLGGEVGIELYEPGAKRQKYVSTNKISGTNEWTLLLGRYRPQSCDGNNQTSVKIRAGRVIEFSGGEFWVDDVFIVPINKLPSFRPSDRLFIYAHLIDPHGPYLPPREYLNLFHGGEGGSLVDKYDGEIRAQDNQLGLLFEGLQSAGVLDQTLVVITSDHGEEFGEHGQWGHSAKQFHEEVARVPLIFYSPKLFPDRNRRGGPVESSVDLLPSLIDLLGLSPPEGTVFQGISYFGKQRFRPRLSSLYETPYTQIFWDDRSYLKTVTDGRWKYITNQYQTRVGDSEVRAIWRKDEGVELTVTSPGGEEGSVYSTVEDLENSELFKSSGEEIQAGLKSAYLAAEDQEAMLYNLKEDPREKDNMVAIYPEKAEEFQRFIEERIEADRNFRDRVRVIPGGKSELGGQLEKELRALGYLN